MKICKVIGNVQASIKDPVYQGHKVMMVQGYDPVDERNEGESFLSVDFVQAGPGDIVLVSQEGNAARQLFHDDSAPVHSVILGIIDTIEQHEA